MTQRTRWMLLCLSVALAVETLWLWDVLLGTHTPFARDVLAFTTPYGAEAGRLWREGVWPWWSGRLGGGMPVFHHPSAEVATVFTPLYALLPPLHAFGVQLWACVVLSSVGVALLARAMGARWLLAAWAGVAWVACGPVASVWTVGHAARHVVVPYLALGLLRALRRQRGGLVLLVVCSAWAAVFPDPLVNLGRVAVVAAVVAGTLRLRRLRRHREAVPRAAVALVAGALLAAPVVVPQAMVVGGSARDVLEVNPRAGFSTASLLNSLAPGAAGMGGASGAGAGLSLVRDESTVNLVDNVFVGWVTVLLLLLADRRLVRRRRFLVPLCGALVLGGLSRGALVPGTGWLWTASGMRFPDKLLEPAALLLILAAAHSGSRALRRRVIPLRVGAVAVLGLVMFVAARPWGASLTQALAATPALQEAALGLLVDAFSLTGSVMLLLGVAALGLRARPRVLEVVLVVLGLLEMTLSFQALVLVTPVGRVLDAPAQMLRPYSAGQRVLAASRGASLYAPQLLDETLADNDLQGRLLMAVGQPNAPVLLGASMVAAQDFSRLEPRHMRLFFREVMASLDNAQAVTVARKLGAQRVVLRQDAAAVDGTVGTTMMRLDLGAGGRFVDVDVRDPLPPLGAEHDAAVVLQDAQAGAVLANPAGPRVVVDTAELPVLAPDAVLSGVVVQDAEQRFTVEAPQHALVVVRGTYAPGWTVTVDGAAQTVLRANVMQRAVLVPPGRHDVVMRYEPPGFHLGLALAAVGLLLLVLLRAGVFR